MASSTSPLILHSLNNPNSRPRRPTSAAGTDRRRSLGEVRATANPDRPPSMASSSSSNGWWTTIFGWPSEPDYIDGPSEDGDSTGKEDNRPKNNGSLRFSGGCFTEEKAMKLRMKTMEGSTFHDVMYHSTIASRLASRFPDRGSSDISGGSPDL